MGEPEGLEEGMEVNGDVEGSSEGAVVMGVPQQRQKEKYIKLERVLHLG